MPYVIFMANGEEYDRRELTRPIVLGRAPDCDIAIPDITLSRHHCRLEPSENGRSWQIVDLHSKNGTHFLGQKVENHVFRDRDELRIGRTRLTFRAGEFVPSSKVKTRGVIRPTDPHEALAGTVTGIVLCEPGETETYEGMPVPQPRPSDPMSFQKDDIYGMINEIASSSWDSIQAQASQPTRMQRAMPTPAMTQANRGSVRPKPRVAFCLQAQHEEQAQPAPASGASASAPKTAPASSLRRPASPSAGSAMTGAITARMKLPRLTFTRERAHKWLIAAASAAVIAILFTGWCALLIHATSDPAAPVPARPRSTTDDAPAAVPVSDASPKPAAGVALDDEAY